MSFLAAAISFIVCHGGPADHFATFADHLSRDGEEIEIYAAGPALKKMQERSIAVKVPFSIDGISSEEEDALANQIAEKCSRAKAVVSDVGHAFDIKIQKALALRAPHVLRIAYYDNPEPYVPGSYSSVAADVMQSAQKVLFANSNLAEASIFHSPGKEIDLRSQKKIGVGYYPITQAEKIAQRRIEEKPTLRQALLQKNGLIDKGQKILVYFGGNNEEYFLKALPAFLSLLEQGMEQSDFTNLVIVFQQHPGAKAKNIDRNLVEEWTRESTQKILPSGLCQSPGDSTIDKKGSINPIQPPLSIADPRELSHQPGRQNLLSTLPSKHRTPKIIFNSDDAQIVADGALYYQTSMGPQFVLAGIPTFQIGHEIYEDILVRNKLSPSVTNVEQLIDCIDHLNQTKKEVPRELILKGLGIKEDWLQILKSAL